MTELLFVDTETNGLPADYNAPASDLDNWPRIVSVAWIVYRGRTPVETRDFILKPDDFQITPEASAIHGITQERASAEGVERRPVFVDLAFRVLYADLVVGHNIAFDRNVIEAEFIRNGIGTRFGWQIDTMTETIDFVGLAGRYGKPKWPKLTELHEKLFGEAFDGAHSALADIEATARCFWALAGRPDISAISPAIANATE